MMKKSTTLLSLLMLFAINFSVAAQTESSEVINLLNDKLSKDSLTTIEPKETLGSEVQSRVTVQEDNFNKGFITSSDELIIGKVAGLNISSMSGKPNSTFSTILHTQTTFMHHSTSPLIIIDNIPQLNHNYVLNPSDIESITVLKDAASTGLYADGHNGAISIKTKRGTKNLLINYSANLALSFLPKQVDVYSANEYRSLMNSRYASDPYVLGLLGSANTNWQDEIYQTAFSQDHFLSLSGTSEIGKSNKIILPYRLSVGKTIQEGILKTSEMDRNTVDMTIDPSFFDNHLKFNLNFKGSFIDEQIADDDAIQNAIFFDPTQPVYNGSPYGGYFTWMSGGAINIMAPINPVALLDWQDNNSKKDYKATDLSVDYKFHFLPELRVITSFATSNFEDNTTLVTKPEAIPLNARSPKDRSSNDTYKSNYWDINFKYSKQLGSSKVDFVAGMLSKVNEISYTYSSQFGGGSSSETNKGLAYIFGGAYNYQERYSALLNYRIEGSTRFSDENKFYSYYSGGLAWNVKNELFLVNSKNISMLNIRASFGISPESSSNSSESVSDPSRPVAYDPNITNEKNNSINVGVDFGLFSDRLTGSADYYSKNGKDLIMYIPVPTGTGFSNFLITNAGEIETKCFDFYLNAQVIKSEKWNWSVGANMAYTTNKIMSLYTNDPNYIGIQTGAIHGGTGSTAQIQSVGYPMNSFFLLEQVYNSAGAPLEGIYVGGDGSDLNDYKRMEKPEPDITLGISSILNYKQWEFSFSGRASVNNWVYNNTSSVSAYSNLYQYNGYTSNTPSSVSSTNFSNQQYYSNYFLEDASYFKMDYMSLGYQLEKLFKGKLGLNVSATVQNVFTITKYSGQDPEVVGGIDFCEYTRPRTVSLKLNFTF